MKHFLFAGITALLLAWLIVELRVMFDGPYQPNPDPQEPDISFIDLKDLNITPSRQCTKHKQTMQALIDAPQWCEIDADCSPLTVKGQAMTNNNRIQYLNHSRKTIELCPQEVFIQVSTAINPYSKRTVSCVSNICQSSDLTFTQNLVNDTLQQLKKP